MVDETGFQSAKILEKVAREVILLKASTILQLNIVIFSLRNI
jgi:hypothetical protein